MKNFKESIGRAMRIAVRIDTVTLMKSQQDGPIDGNGPYSIML